MKTFSLLLVLVLGLQQACSPQPSETTSKSNKESSSMTTSNKAPAVPNQYLISFETDSTSQERDAIIASVGAQMLDKVGSTLLFLIEIEKNEEAALEKLRKTPKVRYVEPNFTMSTMGN